MHSYIISLYFILSIYIDLSQQSRVGFNIIDVATIVACEGHILRVGGAEHIHTGQMIMCQKYWLQPQTACMATSGNTPLQVKYKAKCGNKWNTGNKSLIH